ncbi:hypothetical protein V6N13_145293 [Hibiscus sabdariffa]
MDKGRDKGTNGTLSIQQKIRGLPTPYKADGIFESATFLKEFEDHYSDLDVRHKLCLLCFAIFPENVVVKKRLLRFWWEGEKLHLETKEEKKEKEKLMSETKGKWWVNKILEKFVEMGFVEPVTKRNRSQDVPAPIAKEGEKEKEKEIVKYPENLQTVFNVSEKFPHLFKELFSKMKNIGVLYMGRWEPTVERHIMEKEKMEFLAGLENLRRLRFFSLQGIFGISKLPESPSKLNNLRFLDWISELVTIWRSFPKRWRTENKWEVKILRLKYLANIKINWKELQVNWNVWRNSNVLKSFYAHAKQVECGCPVQATPNTLRREFARHH